MCNIYFLDHMSFSLKTILFEANHGEENMKEFISFISLSSLKILNYSLFLHFVLYTYIYYFLSFSFYTYIIITIFVSILAKYLHSSLNT